MFAKACACSLVAWMCVVSPAVAQTALRWKFVKGQVYEVERTATQKQTVAIKGKQQKQERRSTWYVRLEVGESHADGIDITALLTKVEHRLKGAGETEAIDPKLADKMQGSSFALVVTPDGRLAQLKGYEDFLSKLAQNDPDRLKALRINFAEQAVRDAFADLFGPLPSKAVVQGEAWEHETREPIPHFGALRSTMHYVYEGSTKGHERIAYTIRTAYELPKAEMMVLFRIVKGSIDSDKARGAIVFDASAGHLIEHERSMLLRGTLTVESMDRQQPLEFTSANELKVRVTRK